MLVLVTITAVQFAFFGAHMSCTSALPWMPVFFARFGAAPFWFLIPCALGTIYHRLWTWAESKVYGPFIPKMGGAIIGFHIWVGWLCLLFLPFHVAGHLTLNTSLLPQIVGTEETKGP
jgi:hypothetical protein